MCNEQIEKIKSILAKLENENLSIEQRHLLHSQLIVAAYNDEYEPIRDEIELLQDAVYPLYEDDLIELIETRISDGPFDVQLLYDVVQMDLEIEQINPYFYDQYFNKAVKHFLIEDSEVIARKQAYSN